MTMPDLRSNYSRALRAAYDDKDRRLLTKMLRMGIRLYPADMSMLANFIEGRFRPLSIKPPHRPKLTIRDLCHSEEPLHMAIITYWGEAEVLRRAGEAYGKLSPLNDDIAARHGITPESLRRGRERHRAINPFTHPPKAW